MGVSQSKNDDRQYRFARYSIVLGFLKAIPDVVFGHVFLTSHKKNECTESATYRRMAMGGLIFGYIGIIYSSVLVILLFKIFP